GSTESMVATGVVSAAAATLSREVLRIMMLQKLELAAAAVLVAGILAWGGSAALVPRGDELGKEAGAPSPAPLVQRAGPAPAPRPAADPDRIAAVGTFPVRGRVLDPAGRPVAGAEIFIRHQTQSGWDPVDPVPKGQKGRVAVSDADGRFHFDLDKASSDWLYG